MKRFGYKIKLIYNKFKSDMERSEIFQNSRLTRTEFMILRYVLSQKDLKCMRDVQEEFNINRSTSIEYLSSLENKGFVEKIVNENDSRIKYINVTDSGKKEYKKIVKEFERLNTELVSVLTPEETEQFSSILDKIIESENFKKGDLNEKDRSKKCK